MSNNPAIVIEDLTFSYGDVPVLEEVCLTVDQGSFCSIVGPNGGGKTTLLKLILGLLKPDRGRVSVLGGAAEKSWPRVGYMPQHARLDLQFPVNALDIVLMGRLGQGRNFGPFGEQDRNAAIDALRTMGLDEYVDRPLASLSGGQQQRVLIARARACNPDLLLLDEPKASLDLRMEGEFFELLGELNRRMTVIIVSHDLGFVSGFVNSCICVNRRVQVHPTSEITGEMIGQIYGGDVRLVRHDLHCTRGEGQ